MEAQEGAHKIKIGENRIFTYSMAEGGTGGPHDHLRDRNGEKVEVIALLPSDEIPTYKVKFPDDFEYDVFEDEI